jgi:hypothetical protein
MGNCFAVGLAGQFHAGSCCTQTPQRMTYWFETTIDCFVKSRPVGSLAEWHSTQYVEKNPCAQLAHVSPAASASVPLLLPVLLLPVLPLLLVLPLPLPLPLDDPPFPVPDVPDEHAPARTEAKRHA